MFLAVFIPALLGGLAQIMGSLVGRVLLALGISYVTYKGASTSIDYVASYVRSALGSGPSVVTALLSFLWVDKAVSVTFASYVAAVSIKSIGGAVTRTVIGKK